MTRREKDLLDFIKAYWSEKGYSPSFKEMQEGLGLKSRSSIHRLIQGLVLRGHIERIPYRARSIGIVANYEKSLFHGYLAYKGLTDDFSSYEKSFRQEVMDTGMGQHG